MKAKRHSSARLVVLLIGFGDRTQAAPTLITACGAISTPGSYRLANNLTANPGSSCLVLHATNITIDLDGFTITGTGGNYGIYSFAARKDSRSATGRSRTSPPVSKLKATRC